MMTNEIKEILDSPKILMLSYGNYISLNDYVKLKDYITNLQEENEKLLKKSYSDDVRITKAIEWVKKNMYYFPRPDELLKILKGEDNDN